MEPGDHGHEKEADGVLGGATFQQEVEAARSETHLLSPLAGVGRRPRPSGPEGPSEPRPRAPPRLA